MKPKRRGTPPAVQGFSMPAEWAPHAATWIAWPHERSDWPGRFAAIPWAYAEIVRPLAPRETVHILVQDAATERRAARTLRQANVDAARVRFHRVPTDRSWTRDSGPTFVCHPDGRRAAIHWRFNGWAKYANHKRDRKVGARIAALAGVEAYAPDAVMEGGAIDADGEGTLLCTEECLLSDVQARNPALGREGTERLFAETLGARKAIWLGRGIAGDDTHGHIDDLARFVGPGRVLLALEGNPRDENYAPLQENRERLQGAVDAAGRRIETIPLPMPSPVVIDGTRVPASYANFYIANGVVMVPTFNDPKDRIVLGLLAELFPGREVVGIHAGDLIWGLGTLHCLTQQEPAPLGG
jgi:agmatine deiminase